MAGIYLKYYVPVNQIGENMMINPIEYHPKGDKVNSDYFNEYKTRIYERRLSSGLEDLFGDMCGVVVQVQTGDAIPYIKELYSMTPYRYSRSYISDTHKIYCLLNTKNSPAFLVLEPLDPNFKDDITRLNKMYPNSRAKFNARYVGEIYKCKDKDETRNILVSHDFNFHNPDMTENKFYCNKHIHFTRLSDFTYNCAGYTDDNIYDFDCLELGQRFYLTKEQEAVLDAKDQESHDNGIKDLIKGIDHMATRILAGEREDAILEFLCLSKYYFWGAYNIYDMNSSTNVNRNPHGHDIKSPAKVFTANNTPFMVNSFENLPMPTETFVRNYGRRMHHIAYEVKDGDHSSGKKNIDFVVETLRDKLNIEFLAKVFGACEDSPDLKQIFSKHSIYSILITEYVERCHNFDGFFTKENVAALTEAASLDETTKQQHKKASIIGD
ncbi:lpg1639 family Dot/Icm T4SS effector [Legionella pneumophila serogroup 1]|uniref:lpg1639 family Dot/Icm T4SS effector n=1 Tax=Legionella pneumophila TaxID=446 RepID=UPI00093061FA|nr:lpg1639 family Dot/Icm T4SS effector [Legionella pneumophila]HAT8944542.1 lpg1639 family Dot/Icm T4SS effector [Legionella pneumophila subsp. pneumophila]MCH9059333.1 lpg1639 family Dot/Icm T4SS effector [Legionella pneumophila serogroup 1]MCH9061926.1 lpg1639 family Dot/Icm T4SS effector [Legionella pneumophila serogroup 1]MCH9066255.1 lpg1639 family Dot/Icm T4SS effector [Legionella pneumophila serogroup 1]MCH9067999.1 lpg1639 family Dot/Icm T4SS effector [Legionella pneumophila serogroup